MPETTPQDVAKIIGKFGPIRLRIGRASFFPATKERQSDILKFEVVGDDLFRLNRILKTLPGGTNGEFQYQPHVTVAHLKPGLGEMYVAQTKPLNLDVTIEGMYFSDRDGNRTWISTTGKPAPPVKTNNWDNPEDVRHYGNNIPPLYYAKKLVEPEYHPEHVSQFGVIHPMHVTDTVRALAREYYGSTDEEDLAASTLLDEYQVNPNTGLMESIRPRPPRVRPSRLDVGPILADALQDVGSVDEAFLKTLRDFGNVVGGTYHHALSDHIVNHPYTSNPYRGVAAVLRSMAYDPPELLANKFERSLPQQIKAWREQVEKLKFVELHNKATGGNPLGLPPGYIDERKGGSSSGGMRGNPPPGVIWYRPAYRSGQWSHAAQHKQGRPLTSEELTAIWKRRVAAEKQQRQQNKIAKLTNKTVDQGPPRFDDMERLSRYAQSLSNGGQLLPGQPEEDDRFVPDVSLESQPSFVPQEQVTQPSSVQDSQGRDLPPPRPSSTPPSESTPTFDASLPQDLDYSTPDAFGQSIANALATHGRDENERAYRASAGLSVAQRLPRLVYDRLSEGRLRSVVSHSDPNSIRAAWVALGESDANVSAPEGFYDPDTGIAAVNGEDPDGVFAHELGHALDWSQASGPGGYYQFSSTPEWQNAWKAELAHSDVLSRYSQIDPQEGFAEMCRMLYSFPDGFEIAARYFPKSYAVFASFGLV